MTRLTMRIVAGLGALALVGTMTACSRPTTAATVGSERITVAEVQELTDGLPVQVRAQPGRGQESQVLNLRMRALAARQVAEQRGIQDLQPLAETAVAQLQMPDELRADPELRSLLISEAEAFVLREHIGTQQMEEAFARIPVTVNPRYGFTGLEHFETVRNTSLSKRAGQPE
ncbi:hypothetical protein [Granulicoccus sp. GXG6511]|uniref:hypothetical protein n=1 Tax=Granulicoccus sp. GXG6511 TaxID=3381351 RepID=UPI003D7CB558